MRESSVFVLSCMLSLLFIVDNSTRNTPPPDRVRHYADLFAKAKSEREKLGICIDAVDEGLIRRDGSVRVIDEIFGTNCLAALPEDGEAFDWVHFGKFQPAPNVDGKLAAGRYVGWYFVFFYDNKGDIIDYHISNIASKPVGLHYVWRGN